MKLLCSPESLSGGDSPPAETKFDFTHLAESIEQEQKNKARQCDLTPTRPIVHPRALPAATASPYQVPWFVFSTFNKNSLIQVCFAG